MNGKRLVIASRYPAVRPGSVAPEGVREPPSGSGDPAASDLAPTDRGLDLLSPSHLGLQLDPAKTSTLPSADPQMLARMVRTAEPVDIEPPARPIAEVMSVGPLSSTLFARLALELTSSKCRSDRSPRQTPLLAVLGCHASSVQRSQGDTSQVSCP
jgi:hypothetical protein